MTVRLPDTVKRRLIVALDVDKLKDAEKIVERLHPDVTFFKIGKQLFLNAGPESIRMVRRHGCDVFLDLKFHDIPTTVAKAGVEAARLGVRFFNVHASGSIEMMEKTRIEVAAAARREGLRRPKILAVTVLTSLGARDLRRVGIADAVENQVVRLARLAKKAGMDGVVASPLEVARIRRNGGKGLLIVTPGVRPVTASRDDQKRVLSPGEAVRAGADYLVVGRPITEASDPRAVVREIVADMARGVTSPRPRRLV